MNPSIEKRIELAKEYNDECEARYHIHLCLKCGFSADKNYTDRLPLELWLCADCANQKLNIPCQKGKGKL